MPEDKLKIAVLISGSGRTLKNFIELAAEDQLPVEIRLVVSSSAKAGGLKIAEEAGSRRALFAGRILRLGRRAMRRLAMLCLGRVARRALITW